MSTQRVVAKIGASGFFISDVLLEDGEPLPTGCIESRPPEGFYSPLWTGSAWAEGKPAAEILTERREAKEVELRGAADGWYQANVRSFEGAIVTAKYGRSGLTALNAEERAVFDAMNANYTRLKGLIVQVRAAATLEEVEAISWS
jgi:hypothetical protein